jgi:hypothetical protein
MWILAGLNILSIHLGANDYLVNPICSSHLKINSRFRSSECPLDNMITEVSATRNNIPSHGHKKT